MKRFEMCVCDMIMVVLPQAFYNNNNNTPICPLYAQYKIKTNKRTYKDTYFSQHQTQ